MIYFTSEVTNATKMELARRLHVPGCQIREATSQLVRDGLIVRERVRFSASKGTIVYRVRVAESS